MLSEYTKETIDNINNAGKFNNEMNLKEDKHKEIQQSGEKRETKDKEKINANSTIKGWINFLKEHPNGLVQEKSYSKKDALSESIAAGFGISEPKKLGFERNLPDGRYVKVEGGDDKFSLNISKETEDGKKETLNIDISDFYQISSQDNNKNEEEICPKVNIFGNINLLSNDVNLGIEKNLVGDFSISKDDIKILIDTIDKEIIMPQKKIDHGYKNNEDKKREYIENKINEYDLLILELNKEMNENPPITNEQIARYMINGDFADTNQYLTPRKTFLSMCILLRSSSNVGEIKNKLLGDENISIQKSASTKDKSAGENIVEYFGNNESDRKFFIDNEDDLAYLASQDNNATEEEKKFLLK